MRQTEPIALTKAILWEEAKGKLRALVAAEGATFGGKPLDSGEMPFEVISNVVENFITDFEGQGLHE